MGLPFRGLLQGYIRAHTDEGVETMREDLPDETDLPIQPVPPEEPDEQPPPRPAPGNDPLPGEPAPDLPGEPAPSEFPPTPPNGDEGTRA
jgi:hypothetical protein